MADRDDGSQSQRESHYNQQRSSPRSDRSLRTPSRPGSSQLLRNFAASEENEESNAPSPSPVIPVRRQSLEDATRKNSRNGNSGRTRRGSMRYTKSRDGKSGSRDGEWDDYDIPGSYGNINEILGLPPLEKPRGQTTNQRDTLEEERASERLESRSSKRRSRQQTPLSRRGTAADFTALPAIRDGRGETSAQVSRVATELYTVSYLILFSILGTLARLGLQWLAFYPGAPIVFSEVWANFAGTLFMGFLAEDSRLFCEEWGEGVRGVSSSSQTERNDEEKAMQLSVSAKAEHARVKKTIPLYIGLATGFCGSFTSFSSFMRDAFLALSNNLPSPINHPSSAPVSISSTIPRNGGYSFMAVCAVIITTVTLCYSALNVGAHIAICTSRFIPTLSFFVLRRIIDPLVVFIAWGAWLGAVFMAIWPPDRPGGPSSHGSWANETWRGQAIFACAFAPVGCLLRFYISLGLNGLNLSFPLGTFCVNIFGTAVLGMAFDLQHVRIGSLPGGGRIGCQALQGVMDGFCGALTTVSTWIAEINGLRRGNSYAYAIISVAVGLGVLVCVMGSVRWTVGFTAIACVTGRTS